jgi:methionyl aminopeptidase
MPFSISGFEDMTGTKVGVKECVEHEMLEQYQVMTEKPGEYVAQFKATLVVQPSSTVIICGGAAPTDKLDSDKEVKDDELKTLLAKEMWKREKKAKKPAEKKEEKK